MEIWKDIKGYEGFYQVSNSGNVKSLYRIANSPRNTTRIIKERILSPSPNKGGYLSIVLSMNSVCKTFPIHKLVAEHFLNHTSKGQNLVVNHKDFNRKNNNLCNLEIVTQRENANKKHLKSSSKYTGVCWFSNKNKWISQIIINNKSKYLGLFTNEHDAHIAYEKALSELLNQSEI